MRQPSSLRCSVTYVKQALLFHAGVDTLSGAGGQEVLP